MPKAASSTFIQKSRAIGAGEKAAFHVVTGAGRSHVKRDFFGLSSADEEALIDRLSTALDTRVQQERL